MKYLEYVKCKVSYEKILNVLESIVEEKEQIFISTQPKATKLDKLSVEGGVKPNLFDEYLIKVEKKQLDLKLKEAQKLVDTRYKLLKEKELDLRNSKEWIDKIYVYKFIEKLPVKAIIHLIPYEEAQIYRIITEIKKNTKDIEDE